MKKKTTTLDELAATTNRAFQGVQKQLDHIRKEMVTKRELRSQLRASETRILKAIRAHSSKGDVEELHEKITILQRQMIVVRERLGITE